MTFKINNAFNGRGSFTENNAVINNAIENAIAAKPQQRKLPPISPSVTFTAIEADTELKLATAGYMAAAAQAGIDNLDARREFAKQMIAANPPDLTLTSNGKKTELDDISVKNRLLNQSIEFTLMPSEVKALENFRAEYAANGGKIRFTKNPTVDMRQPGTADGVTNLPPEPTSNIKVRVLLDGRGNPTDSTRILKQFAEDQYKSGNLYDKNYLRIAEMSIGQGVKPSVTKTTKVGDKYAVEFELTPLDRAKIDANYKIIQAQVNEIDKIVAQIKEDNPVSQFILGAVNGFKDNMVGTAEMLAHPLETLNAIKEVAVALSNLSSEDVAKITEQLKDKITTTFTTEDGINSIPYGAGYAVGVIASEIILGKGAGAALKGLKGIGAIEKLLTKLDDFKAIAKVKIAETFSDEAAAIASQRSKQALATQLYSGIPADILADMAIVAGNKLKNGAIKFGEFSKQMVEEFGDKVKPKLLELYQESFEKVFGKRKDLGLDELLGGHSIERHVGKSDNWLRNRLLDDPRIPSASTFISETIANRTISRFVKENRQTIEDWLESGKHRLDVSFEMNEPVGKVLGRGKGNAPNSKPVETNKVVISFIRDNTPQGWHVNTSFPISPNGGFKW